MQTLLQHKLLLILSGIAVAGIVWYGLSPSSVLPDLVSTPGAEGGAQADPGIVPTLLTLRSVKLDGAVFSSTAFTQLKDFSTEIVSEPVGRTNPFAPLSSPNSTSTQTLRPANR
ncbi:hypothetical protein EXS56_00810 [Candidatus Kaiserbacteria bacterium]|nr:hypothetical protein [Candidatus Kaiserbacteria bacterium]